MLPLLVPVTGIAMLIYVVYCVYHGGMHERSKVWQTKVELPFGYRFGTISLTILGM